ncbi:MAG TPA: hypothetical protein VGX69_12120 [Solirubrobacteraceae bacterium]|jgi:hypothetical protein|nr:hypothetical protein [Solirubrobacteraceae bacterium]
MAGTRSRYGLALSALGAVALAIAVFLPWYGVSFTAGGLALAQRVGDQVATQFGNAALQSQIASLHANLSGLAGHEVFSLSAHQALSTINVVLLVLAGLGCAIALLALAGPAAASSDANRLPLAVLGALAGACVLYRMVDPPTPDGGFFVLALREGGWIALLGAIAMVAGALWPTGSAVAGKKPESPQAVWAQLSGWTPES